MENITISPETLKSLFLKRLKEWERSRNLDSEEFEKLSDYLSELAYCVSGEVNPDLIADEVFFNRSEILGVKDAS